MDNSEVGGKRSDFSGGEKNVSDFDGLEEWFGANGATTENKSKVERGLGEAASSTEIAKELFGEEPEKSKDEFSLPDVPEMMPAPELKPLIADGTTEKKLGKIGVSLVGEKVDVEGVSAAVKKIKELPLYEQSAARDEASAKMIYANFGRMIGNDDIGEIQAEEQRTKMAAQPEAKEAA